MVLPWPSCHFIQVNFFMVFNSHDVTNLEHALPTLFKYIAITLILFINIKLMDQIEPSPVWSDSTTGQFTPGLGVNLKIIHLPSFNKTMIKNKRKEL